MIDEELLKILACPETKEPVEMAADSLIGQLNVRIQQGLVRNRGGQPVTQPLDGGLIRIKDRKYLYPIIDEIPVMLIDEAIPLEGIE